MVLVRSLDCVFRRIPPVIPTERLHRFRRKTSSSRSEATLGWTSFPKWMASVKRETHFRVRPPSVLFFHCHFIGPPSGLCVTVKKPKRFVA
jgi:hypothetical protein